MTAKLLSMLRLPQRLIEILGEDIRFHIDYFVKGYDNKETITIDFKCFKTDAILASALYFKGSHFYYLQTTPYHYPIVNEERIRTLDELITRVVEIYKSI